MLPTPGDSRVFCPDPGLNRGPLDLQSNALPTELSRPVISSTTLLLAKLTTSNIKVKRYANQNPLSSALDITLREMIIFLQHLKKDMSCLSLLPYVDPGLQS